MHFAVDKIRVINIICLGLGVDGCHVAPTPTRKFLEWYVNGCQQTWERSSVKSQSVLKNAHELLKITISIILNRWY